ncbi:sialate O-acetylesterase [Herbivorax sp. ANBcel31]|uniref:sialate O-acetylesterase n=1 Tax=Herbivorax sp. ANBcel31 TaxID=3069754 RepID=UPI0027B5DC26|nr:sialate O-acetylesterase [Herbivorax sp. ANBcel31]MDQ2086975.1 sialate O-acetylesterase [Herbivorax sp. ANBcel31]
MTGNSIKLSPLISDGMVLQRNTPVKIWGSAAANKNLVLDFINKNYKVKSDENGYWEVVLNNLSAGGPYTMMITCENHRKVISDILIGDVWILGGQSNMELPILRTLDLYEGEVKNAKNSNIRHFVVPLSYNFHKPKEDISGGNWTSVNSEDIYEFSAVGYFFAKVIYEKYKVPIGLIRTAVGGTPAEAWLSERTLTHRFKRFKASLNRCKNDEYVKSTIETEECRCDKWYSKMDKKDAGFNSWFSENYDDSSWDTINLPRSFRGTDLEEIRGSIWFRKEINLNKHFAKEDVKLILGTLVDGDETYVNGVRVGSTGYRYPPRRYSFPAEILKEGKNVITVRLITTNNIGSFIKDMPYKLVLGEHEIDLTGTWKYCVGARMEELKEFTFFQYKPTGVYNSIIYPLRKYNIKGALWYQGESNTGYPYDYKEIFRSVIEDWRNTWSSGEFPFLFVQLANYEDPNDSSMWAYLREQQRRSLEIPNTGMAVSIDIGEYNELHPQNKKAVGERLALWAMNKAYRENLICSGPIYKYSKKNNDKIQIFFDYVGSGLISKGCKLKEFTISDKDGRFFKADAVIEGDTVVVSSKEIDNPVHVRYAWSNSPEEANLFNREGLPASPFTTEELE